MWASPPTNRFPIAVILFCFMSRLVFLWLISQIAAAWIPAAPGLGQGHETLRFGLGCSVQVDLEALRLMRRFEASGCRRKASGWG